MKKQFLKAYVKKIDEEKFTLDVAIASDESEDRMGEVIMQDGWVLDNFKKNPVLLWAHSHRETPIGKVTDIKIVDGKLMFSAQFAGEIDPFSKKVWQMFKGGYLNAFSVGFMVLEMEGNKFLKVELLEISAVPVPANANALVVARELGLDKFFKKDESEKETEEDVEEEIEEETTEPAEESTEETEKRVLTTEERAIIEATLQQTKTTADALSALLKNSITEKDNVGVRSHSAEGARSIKIVRSALKQATKNVEIANKAIKIIH